jgi:hypothetical protein
MGSEGAPSGSMQPFREQHWSMAVCTMVIGSGHAAGSVATGGPSHRALSLEEGVQLALMEMCAWYE